MRGRTATECFHPFMSVLFKIVILILPSHVSERPLRSLLTMTGVALGVAASVAVRTANLDVLRSFEQGVLTVAGPTTLEIAAGALGLDEMLVPVVRAVDGVQAANPVILQTIVRAHGGPSAPAVQVLGLDLLTEFDRRGFRVKRDEALTPLDAVLDPQSLFLGRKIAAEWGVAVGETVEVRAGPRRVLCRLAGVLEDASGRDSAWDRLAVMDIAAAQVLFETIGRIDRIDVVTTPGRSVAAIAEAIRAAVPPHLTVERPSSRTQQVEEMLKAFRLNLMVLSWVGLLVGMFLVYNTMAFAVAQRRREVGIYRAMGMSPGGVAILFLAEALVFGLVGGLLGSAAGTVLAQKLVKLVSRTISDLYLPVGDGDGWAFGQFWHVSFEGVLVGCFVAMLGALAPSLDASRTATARALAPGDYEASRQLRVGLLGVLGVGCVFLGGLSSLATPLGGVPVLGYVATFCLLAGLSCLAPLCITGWRAIRQVRVGGYLSGAQGVMRRIAIEHAARNPGRNGVTVSALMVGLAIMIGVVIMVRSFRHTVELWIDQTVIADVVVAPSNWLRGSEAGSIGRSLPPAWRALLSAVPGVAAVDTYRDVRVEANGQRVALVSRDLRLHAERSRYWVRQGDSAERLRRAVETDGVLISEVLANRLHLREGDVVTVLTPEGKRAFPIVAVFYDYATDGGKLVMDRLLYRRLWLDELVTVFPIYLKAGVEVDMVRQAVAEQLAAVNVDGLPPLLISNAELRREILDIFDRTFLLTYALEAIAVIIAMLGIVNTLITSVVERRGEFATLRALGGSEVQIQQLVLWEAAYLGMIGLVLGLAGGGLLALLLIHVINKQSFGWTIQMIVPIGAVLQAVGLAAAATLVAGYVPARWAARQPVVTGLREE